MREQLHDELSTGSSPWCVYHDKRADLVEQAKVMALDTLGEVSRAFGIAPSWFGPKVSRANDDDSLAHEAATL